MPPILRAFRSNDREAVLSLWQACDLVRAPNDPDTDIDRKLARDAENLLVLEEGSRVIATVMVGYDAHRGWINYLAVSPQRRCEGLGRSLVEAAEDRLRLLGCAKVNLQVRSSNASVLGFYRRLGFFVDDVVSMGKRLESGDASS
jgi:ribosomal protein S18 acetylase RimI-like enzyme